jgi:hypothetical protein
LPGNEKALSTAGGKMRTAENFYNSNLPLEQKPIQVYGIP